MKPLNIMIEKKIRSPYEYEYQLLRGFVSANLRSLIRESDYDDILGRTGLAIDIVYYELGNMFREDRND